MALFLSLALSLPAPAFALRQETDRPALEKALHPAAGQRPVVRPPSAEAAGLEERPWPGLVTPRQTEFVYKTLASAITGPLQREMDLAGGKGGKRAVQTVQEVLDLSWELWKAPAFQRHRDKVSPDRVAYLLDFLPYALAVEKERESFKKGPADARLVGQLVFLARVADAIGEAWDRGENLLDKGQRDLVIDRLVVEVTLRAKVPYDDFLTPELQRKMIRHLLEILEEPPAIGSAGRPAAGLEEVDPGVREAIAGLFRLPDDFSRAVWLDERMAAMDLSRLEQLVTHLFWVADREEVGEVLMQALGSNAPPAQRLLSNLLRGLGFIAAQGRADGYLALGAVLAHLAPASRKGFSDSLSEWLNETDPNRQGSLKDLPLHLDEANLEAALKPAWAGLPDRLPLRRSLVQTQEWSAHYESIGMIRFLGSDHYRSKRSDTVEAQWRGDLAILALSVMGELNPRRADEMMAEWKQKIPARLNVPGVPATLAGIWAPEAHPEAKRTAVSQTYGRLAGFFGLIRSDAENLPGREIPWYLSLGDLMQVERLYADYLALWSGSQEDPHMEEEAAKHYALARQYEAQRDQIKERKLKALGLEAGLEERRPTNKVAEAVRRFRVEPERAGPPRMEVGFYLEGEGAVFAPILALLESRDEWNIQKIFAAVVESRQDRDRLLAVLEADPQAQDMLGDGIYVVEDQVGEDRQARYERARGLAEGRLEGSLSIFRVRTRRPDLLVQLNQLLGLIGYRLPEEDPLAQEAAQTLLEAA
ncbi:MAG: hypothetical protein HYZ93_04835 [Candidatus Omnitrophica bacterium]|nr:hypothetical protein [Candidatus Omnitrophota bacterium]